MRRDEAEEEAQRRNASDDRAARLEFYALDQSAGMSDDAWEVASRLRGGRAPAVAEPSPWAAPPRRVVRPAPARPEPAPWDEPGSAPTAAPVPRAAPVPEPAAEPATANERYAAESHAVESHAVESPEAQPATKHYADEPYADEPYADEPYADEPYADEPYADERQPGEPPDHPRPANRPGLFVRFVGGAVMLVALVWVIAIVGLAIVLDSWGPTSLLIYFGAVVLGLGALALGVAILRS